MGSESPFIIPPLPPLSFLEQVKEKIIGLVKKLVWITIRLLERWRVRGILQSGLSEAVKYLRPAWFFVEGRLPRQVRPWVGKNRKKNCFVPGGPFDFADGPPVGDKDEAA